jgi:hypothetical protein
MGGGSATLIRRILIDRRRERAQKRGSRGKVCLDEVLTIPPAMSDGFLILDGAPVRLAKHDLLQDKVASLFWAGLSDEEIADVPHASTPTVGSDCRTTPAWLHSQLA